MKKIFIILFVIIILGGMFLTLNSSAKKSAQISNNFIETPSIPYEYLTATSTTITSDNMSMDEYSLNISFILSLQDDLNANVSEIELIDMIITDENKNILFCEDKDSFNNYCQKNNLNYIWKETNENYINSGYSYYIKSQDLNNINLIYKLNSNFFPNSKKLNISIGKIRLKSEKNIILKGDWNIEIDIPEEYASRNVILYKLEKCTNPNFRVDDLIITKNATKLFLQTDEKSDLPYDVNDDEETKKRKIDESWEEVISQTPEDFKNKRKFKYEYIENENGQKFYPSNSTSEDTGYSYSQMKYLNYWQTFNMSSKDITDKLTIYLNYNGEDTYLYFKRK